MPPTNGTILVVDDDEDIVIAASLLLKRECATVLTAQRPQDVADIVHANAPDAILLDMNFTRGATSGEEGFKLLAEIRALDPRIVVIVITAHGGVQMAVEAMKRGASDFISKPWSNERLLATVKNAVQLSQSQRETARVKDQNRALAVDSGGMAQPIIGDAPALRRVLSLVARAAPTDANVLILGENGTGKDLVAREIWRRSGRADRPFVAVDLGALPEGLFESELFGHKKGAFTDAVADRTGRFLTANGGTLFLDEIANLPLHLQPKLLTAIEQRRVTPVGADTAVAADVRVICATNASIGQLRDEGRFRQDLLYRLNTVEISVPPLRERSEDIPALVGHFLRHFAHKYGVGDKPVEESAMTALITYDWPGNVRALRHAVERAVILCDGPKYRAADFSLPGEARRASAPAATLAEETLNLDALEKAAVENALKKHGYNISHAAKDLGLTRASLYRRMEKHGL